MDYLAPNWIHGENYSCEEREANREGSNTDVDFDDKEIVIRKLSRRV